MEAAAVTFDLGGTLDGPAIPWRPRFEKLYRAAGVRVPDEVLARAFYDADDHLHERHDLAKLDLAATVRLQVADTVENFGGDPAIVAGVADAFVAAARASLRATIPWLRDLGRRFKLGIVSNNYGNVKSMMRAEGMDSLFSVLIDSREIGFEKPDARIFRAACEGLGLPPSRVAHVGDSFPRDVVGARNAGMKAVWFAPADAVAPEKHGFARIARLEETEAAIAQVLVA